MFFFIFSLSNRSFFILKKSSKFDCGGDFLFLFNGNGNKMVNQTPSEAMREGLRTSKLYFDSLSRDNEHVFENKKEKTKQSKPRKKKQIYNSNPFPVLNIQLNVKQVTMAVLSRINSACTSSSSILNPAP